MFNSLASVLTGQAAGQSTKKIVDTGDTHLDRIIKAGVQGAAAGAVTGATIGAFADDYGTVLGGYLGAKIGFSAGILKQAVIESAIPVDKVINYISEIIDPAISTVSGYIDIKTR